MESKLDRWLDRVLHVLLALGFATIAGGRHFHRRSGPIRVKAAAIRCLAQPTDVRRLQPATAVIRSSSRLCSHQ